MPPTVFAELTVSDGWASVVRGPGEVDPSDFDVSRVYPEGVRTLFPAYVL